MRNIFILWVPALALASERVMFIVWQGHNVKKNEQVQFIFYETIKSAMDNHKDPTFSRIFLSKLRGIFCRFSF